MTMIVKQDSFEDFLSGAEADFVGQLLANLPNEPWAQTLLRDIKAAGGLNRANKAKFFELRFGHALRQAGIVPRYEVPGEGESTIDFAFASAKQEWLVELMRLEETAAARQATQTQTDEEGMSFISRILSTTAKDPRQSEEGETLKAVQRICQKCESNGRPYKFPKPYGPYQLLLVDTRLFLHGGDQYDYMHVGLGGKVFRSGFFRRFWDGKLISGVFSEETNVRGATEARDRIHFIGFVNEKEYRDGAFAAATQFIANPYLFKSVGEVEAAMATWPLQPTKVLNGRR